MASIEEKKSKNMLWVGIISICMIFAGFTSAYLVSKTDNFWVEVEQPWWFMVSTIVIVLSSLTFYLAKRSAASDNKPMIKVWMAITLVLGGTFTYTQFKGWGELTEKGYFFVGPIKAPGTYGENVIVYKDGKPFDFDGSRFYYDGKPIDGELKEEFSALAEELSKLDGRTREHDLSEFTDYKIDVFYMDSAKFDPFGVKGGQLTRVDPMGNEHGITGVQAITLKKFAENVLAERGYFYMSGEYGKDYVVKFRDKELEYKNGRLYVDGQELSEKEYIKLEGSVNTASSFVYILSALHLLHLIGGLIYVLVVFTGALKEKYDSHNHLKIKLGSIYWHFLDLLWIYLYLFLTFIH